MRSIVVLALAASGSLLGSCSSDSAEDDAGGDNSGTGADIDLMPSSSTSAGNQSGTDITSEQGEFVPVGPGGIEELQESACAGWAAEPELLPSVLEVVVDVSGSMGSAPPNANDSKWEITREALLDAIAAMPATITLGLSFYPNADNGGIIPEPRDLSPCIDTGDNVPIEMLGAPGSAHREALVDALERVEVEPDGATPTHDAYRIALDELAQSGFAGNRFVLLITDGQPTLLSGCYGKADPYNPEDVMPIIDEISLAYAGGTRTFMIGSPGSEQNVGTGADVRGWLSQAARAGGTAPAGCSDAGPAFCHFDMSQEPDFGQALRQAIGAVAGQVVSCSYDIPTPPSGESLDLNRINIVYTNGSGEQLLIGRNSAAACQYGWQLTSSGTVEICPATCDTILNDPLANVQVLFDCADQVEVVE